ncbi:MAG: hypothetical protein ACUVUG_09910, partial [Candidatus Aminicenantia bacterium]
MGKINLLTPIRYVKGVGKKRAEILKKEGIETVEDILYYFPFRYEDRSKISLSFEGKDGEKIFTKGKILALHSYTTFRKRINIIEARIDTGNSLFSALWFNQPFFLPNLKKGKIYSFYGKIKLDRRKGCVMDNPDFKIIEKENSEVKIMPIYERIKNISQKIIRNLIDEVFKSGTVIKENLPEFILK